MTEGPAAPASGHELEALRGALAELAPLWRRAVRAEPAAPTRLRLAGSRLTALVRTVGVLAGRPVSVADTGRRLDATYRAAELLAWLDPAVDAPPGSVAPVLAGPPVRDADWRWTLPPLTGWRHVDDVPDTAVRNVVRSGAMTLTQADQRTRTQATDALLDSVVLKVSDGVAPEAQITLRALSALTRMGFLARHSTARVDVSGAWTRVAGAYGSVYQQRPGVGLAVLR